MAKKKEKPQIINNIQELNLEIDYDKLAKAIVQAQNSLDEIPEESDDTPITPIRFWKGVCNIIVNKKGVTKDLLAASMSLLLSFVFNVLAILLILVAIASFILCGVDVYKVVTSDISLWFEALVYFCTAIVLLFLSLLMRGIANDISWENNKNYIVSAFSGVVSFAALVVALVALLTGVG